MLRSRHQRAAERPAASSLGMPAARSGRTATGPKRQRNIRSTRTSAVGRLGAPLVGHARIGSWCPGNGGSGIVRPCAKRCALLSHRLRLSRPRWQRGPARAGCPRGSTDASLPAFPTAGAVPYRPRGRSGFRRPLRELHAGTIKMEPGVVSSAICIIFGHHSISQAALR